jgi:hypothetical protein
MHINWIQLVQPRLQGGADHYEVGDARHAEELRERLLALAVAEGQRQPRHLAVILLKLRRVLIRGHEDDLEGFALPRCSGTS